MPRRAVRVLPAVLLGAMVGLGGCAPEPLDALALKSVNIEVSCVDDAVAFKLWPWVARVQSTATAGDELDWTMTVQDGSVAEYEIVPAAPGSWPYAGMVGKGNGTGRPNVPLPSGKMKKGAASPNPYKYTIEFNCLPANSANPVRVIIDPDVVVDGAGE